MKKLSLCHYDDDDEITERYCQHSYTIISICMNTGQLKVLLKFLHLISGMIYQYYSIQVKLNCS